MILNDDMYVPALRWRQGEYQALLRLSSRVKDRIVPYITIPEVEFDFEERRPKKSVQEHVHPFAARYKAKWGKRPAWVSVHSSVADRSMDDGRDVFSHVFEALRSFEASAIPAVPLGASVAVLRSVAAVILEDTHGAAVLVRLEDLMKPDPKARIVTTASSLGTSLDDVDLIVDLGAPNFEPYSTFAGALVAALRRLGDLQAFRNFIVIGTAIPKTFGNVARGADTLPRHEWLFYRTLLARMPGDMRRPNFGDHTIVHPEFTPMDMRMIKSACKVIYTTADRWEVRKGGAFRDNREEMHDLCASIVNSGKFCGAGYSTGDEYIARCAARQEGPSNQTRWKDVGINHHMTHVLDDLATLGAAP